MGHAENRAAMGKTDGTRQGTAIAGCAIVLRPLLALAVPALLVAACAGTDGTSSSSDPEHLGEVGEGLTAQCTATVAGHGKLDVEDTYLPDVVHCENGGAPLESLKAQAIAARTYLYYKLETSGSIGDGQGDQVYSCGSHADALQKQAVKETAGMVLRYGTTTICSFFVAGGTGSPPACHDAPSSTSGDVTYNAGKSGNNITQTPLGFVSPSNARNRGCMSQLGSRCLADEGKKYDEILKFYYGADIAITTATGPCVPVAPTADAGADAAKSDGSTGDGGDEPGQAGADSGPGSAHGGTSGAAASPSDSSQDSGDSGGCVVARSPGAAGHARTAPWTLGAALALGLLVAARTRRARARARA